MKIYEVTMADLDPRCCYPDVDENSPWFNEGLAANEYEKVHELPIPLIVKNKYVPYDRVLSVSMIVSKKAFELMKTLNKNITGFESQMYYKGEKIWDIYYTIVFPKYNVFNYEKSIYEMRTSPITGNTYIRHIKKLVFDAEKLRQLTDDNFFAMEEKPTRVYCTEKAKLAIEASDLIGFDFEEIPVE